VFRGFRFDHSSLSVDPCAFDGASRVTGSEANSGIVSDPLYLSSDRIGANEKFSILFDEPNRRADWVPSFPVRFETDMFLSYEF